MPDGVEVRLGGPDDVEASLAVLGAAYDRPFTLPWFEWKHRECPWGASRLYIAEDDEGILGLFFALRWPYRRSGAVVEGARLVDGATLPAARGKRVLGLLIRRELANWGPEHPGVLLATATPAAQKSHERNGATTLAAIPSAYGIPTSLRPARLLRGADLLDGYVGDDSPTLATDWTPASLRWRTDPRSGRDYRVSALANADGANGLVYRIGSQRGLRTLFPTMSWGSDREQRRLLGATALSHGCITVLAPTGAGVPPPHLRAVRPSGQSVMCVWDRTDDPASATVSSSWRLSMADLEGLI